MATCKGRKKDGIPCRSPIVLDNGYCRAHQEQATETGVPEDPTRWTRERLEAAIAAHGGPEGLDLAGADLSNLDLQGINLVDVNLQGADLRGANLQGGELHYTGLQKADLRDADLRGANLWDANLRGVRLEGANLQVAGLADADLQRAYLRDANLQGASLASADLRGAVLWGADLEGASLASANLQRARLEGANLRFADLREVDLLYIKTGGLLGIKLYRAKLDHMALRREQLGPAIGEEQAGEYRQAWDAYMALKRNFEGLGDYEAASWSYVKERQMEKACSAPWRARWFYGEEQLGDTLKHKFPAYHPRVWWFFARHTSKWIRDGLVWLICEYGENPWRTVATMVVVFALFMGIYWATWAVMRVEEIPEAIVRVPTRNLVDLAVFGLGAFTTMDPKGLEPRATWVQFVAGFEALLGIGLTGLLGFVLGNRIRRS